MINADTTAIQNLFMQIVKDIKSQSETAIGDSKAATAEILERLRQELTKGQDSLDLRNLSAEDLTAAVIRTIGTTSSRKH